jgi:hypothetical protein
MHIRHLSPGVAIAVLLSVGCVSDDEPSATGSGALGKGSFSQVCGAADALCDEGVSDLDIPARIAQGATIRFGYTGRIPEAPNGEPATLTIVSGSPSMLTPEGNAMRALSAGYVAVLARTDLGTVTDFAHVHITPISSLVVEGPASVRVGESIALLASPRDVDGEALGGSVSYAWASADAGVAAVDDVPAGKASIRGVQPGATTITASVGDVVGALTVTVEAP